MRGFRWMMPLAALLASGLLVAPASAQDCDRACLSGMITQYVEAIVAQDPSALPLADKVKVTQDGRDAVLGEGIWKEITGKSTFRHDYVDTTKHLAATHVHLLAGDQPVLYSLVLHMDGRRIAGIETLVQRVEPDSRLRPTELVRPVRGMDDPVPAGQRMSRADMVATALTYAEGLRVGNFTDGGARFAEDAYRVENGAILAGEGCGRDDCGLYSQNIIVHPGIIPSVVAVDEENGTVLLWMNFGDTGSYGENRALVAYESFKVWGGEIHSINAFFAFLPANTARYWPSSDPVPRIY